MRMVGERIIKPICRNVLDPRFAQLNWRSGYDPTYNYVGSDFIKRRYGIALKRLWWGADINPAAWLHDCDFRDGKTFWQFLKANFRFRKNVIKLIAAKMKTRKGKIAARVVGWLHWAGVENVFALFDYYLCK